MHCVRGRGWVHCEGEGMGALCEGRRDECIV